MKYEADCEGSVAILPIDGRRVVRNVFGNDANGYTRLAIELDDGTVLVVTERGQAGYFDVTTERA